MTKRFRRSAGA